MFMFYCSYGSRRYPAMSLSRSSPAAKRVLFNPTRYGLTLEYRNLPSGSGQSQAAKRFAFESKSTYILMFTGVLCFNFVIEEHISSTHSVHFWDCVRFCTADWKMMFFFQSAVPKLTQSQKWTEWSSFGKVLINYRPRVLNVVKSLKIVGRDQSTTSEAYWIPCKLQCIIAAVLRYLSLAWRITRRSAIAFLNSSVVISARGFNWMYSLSCVVFSRPERHIHAARDNTHTATSYNNYNVTIRAIRDEEAPDKNFFWGRD